MQFPDQVEVNNQLYQLGEKIGDGNYGFVFKAQNLKNKKHYAVKLQDTLSPNEEKSLCILSKKTLWHNINIIDVKKGYKLKNALINVIIMELGDGSFQNLIVKGVSFIPIKTRLNYFQQIARGVLELHQLGIIHRDLKPENVVYERIQDDEYILKLCDTGLMRDCQGQKTLKQGTSCYMAPEQIQRQDYDEKIDVWALGMILFLLIKGESLFQGANDNEIQQNILKTTQEDLNYQIKLLDCEDDLKQMLSSLIVIDRNQRITVEELIFSIRNKIQPFRKDLFICKIFSIYDAISKNGISKSLDNNFITIQNLYDLLKIIQIKKFQVDQAICIWKKKNPNLLRIAKENKLNVLQLKLNYFKSRESQIQQQIQQCDKHLSKLNFNKYNVLVLFKKFEVQLKEVQMGIKQIISLSEQNELQSLQRQYKLKLNIDKIVQILKIKEQQFKNGLASLLKFHSDWDQMILKFFQEAFSLCFVYKKFNELEREIEQFYEKETVSREQFLQELEIYCQGQQYKEIREEQHILQEIAKCLINEENRDIEQYLSRNYNPLKYFFSHTSIIKWIKDNGF